MEEKKEETKETKECFEFGDKKVCEECKCKKEECKCEMKLDEEKKEVPDRSDLK